MTIARDYAAQVVALCGHLPLDQAVVKLAHERYDGKDFEACLQAACAELGKCDEIVTLDKQFAKRSLSKLPVRTLA